MPSLLTNQKSTGFTLIEVLIIAPVVILAISGFVALMVVMTADVLVTRDNNNMTYETQDALDLIEQDTRLATQFLVTTQGLPSPQGRDNDFAGTAAFTNSSNALLIGALTTDKNPADPSRKVIFYAGQPNVCGARESYNRPLLAKIIYYKRDTSLWRRVVLPDYNTNVVLDDNTVCANPWQRNTCSPGYSAATRCQTNDAEIMQNVDTFTVKYFSDPASTTELGNGNALNASTVEVTIGGKKKTAGREIASSASLRATKLNSIDVSIPAPGVPDISSQINGNTVTFSWPKVPLASSYALYYNINGGAWTEVIVNALTTSYSITSGPGDTITFHNYARNHTGSSTQGIAVATIPKWYTCNLQDGWQNYQNSYATAAYAKTKDDVVVMKGLIRWGTVGVERTICTLPVGYRPDQRLIFLTATAPASSPPEGAPARIDVKPDGTVVQDYGVNSGWISLDMVRFVPSSAGYARNNMTLENGWQNYGNGWSDMKWIQDNRSRVHLQGLLKNGNYTDWTIATRVPAAQRPPQFMNWPTASNTAFNQFGLANGGSYGGVTARGTNGAGYWQIQGFYYPTGYSGWTSLGLQSGWVHFDPAYSPPAYTKASDNLVNVRGLIKSGTTTAGTVIANLPVGYRPSERLLFTVVTAGAMGRVDVLPNGNIELRTGYSTWISLDSISFMADQ